MLHRYLKKTTQQCIKNPYTTVTRMVRKNYQHNIWTFPVHPPPLMSMVPHSLSQGSRRYRYHCRQYYVVTQILKSVIFGRYGGNGLTLYTWSSVLCPCEIFGKDHSMGIHWRPSGSSRLTKLAIWIESQTRLLSATLGHCAVLRYIVKCWLRSSKWTHLFGR